jgi:hypothetical protein
MNTTTWHNARTDPPPLRQFVELVAEFAPAQWEDSNAPWSQTRYMGWLERGGDGVLYWWAEGRGELDFVTWWRELAPLPTAYQGGHKEA